MYARSQNSYARIAKIVVDSVRLAEYKSALREGIETSVRTEPGVLRMYAVYDSNKPTQVTVFETYASREAYEKHIQTPHFKKYKALSLSMVLSLELTDVVPIIFESKKQE